MHECFLIEWVEVLGVFLRDMLEDVFEYVLSFFLSVLVGVESCAAALLVPLHLKGQSFDIGDAK